MLKLQRVTVTNRRLMPLSDAGLAVLRGVDSVALASAAVAQASLELKNLKKPSLLFLSHNIFSI